MSHCDV